MRAVLILLASRRWAGVGSALLAEVLLLVALSLAPPAATIGIQAAVAAAIAGTVAVVFGIADGVAVATAGAIVFAAFGSWGTGELAAIGLWPAIVAAVGLFARRVGRQRVALRRLVEAEENERRALALTLHDDTAQALTGALLTLRAGGAHMEPATDQTARARELINDTIQQLRRLALELSPKALEDYGLASALGHLAANDASVRELPIAFECDWDGRLSVEAERGLFRFAQAALAIARDCDATAAKVDLSHGRGRVTLVVGFDSPRAAAPPLPAAVEERLRLLGGKVSAAADGEGGLQLRADVPGWLRVEEPGDVAVASSRA